MEAHGVARRADDDPGQVAHTDGASCCQIGNLLT
jgi:hypothetical protein